MRSLLDSGFVMISCVEKNRKANDHFACVRRVFFSHIFCPAIFLFISFGLKFHFDQWTTKTRETVLSWIEKSSRCQHTPLHWRRNTRENSNMRSLFEVLSERNERRWKKTETWNEEPTRVGATKKEFRSRQLFVSALRDSKTVFSLHYFGQTTFDHFNMSDACILSFTSFLSFLSRCRCGSVDYAFFFSPVKKMVECDVNYSWWLLFDSFCSSACLWHCSDDGECVCMCTLYSRAEQQRNKFGGPLVS